MRATKLVLKNFRSAKDLTLELKPGINLLVGVNGAGKTTILDGLAILLSWAAARLRYGNAKGHKISDMDICNGERVARLRLDCYDKLIDDGETLGNGESLDDGELINDGNCFWRLRQPRKGRNRGEASKRGTILKALSAWAHRTRDQIGKTNEQVNLPLFAYYPVNRSVLDIPLRIRKSHDFVLLDAYDNALTAGANFREFFLWFRNREDIENERYREETDHPLLHDKNEPFKKDTQLSAVRKVIMTFLPEFSAISVKRNPLRMEVTKNGKKYHMEQMSVGEKCLFAMVGDLARRLAIANPLREDPLQGEGIILIDEIDLHLHPSWQRKVVSKLTETFPNCQFVLTTHSPQIITHVRPESISLLSQDETGLNISKPSESYGKTANRVLEDIMGLETTRPKEIADELSMIFKLINGKKIDEAKRKIDELKKEIGADPELAKANVLIRRKEIIGK